MSKRLIYSIFRMLMVAIPLTLAMANARAQIDTVYTGQSTVLAVEEHEGISYYWELYNNVEGLNLAVEPGNCTPAEAYFVGGINTGDSVEVMWMMPGTYFFKVTANDSCTNNLKVGKIEVLESISYAWFLQPEPDSICPGDSTTMTIVIEGGLGPWDITYTDGTDTWVIEGIEESPYEFTLDPTPSETGSYSYWITSVTSGTGLVNDEDSDPVTLIVLPHPTTSPIFRYEPTAKK
jgi:hypothetical protein